MKIAVDCRMLESSGIGNFLKNLLINWTNTDGHKFLLIGQKNIIEKYHFINYDLLECDIPIFSYKELFFFPTKEINKCDIYFAPNYNLPLGIRIPMVSTIHDVVFLDQPKLVSKVGLLTRYLYLKYAIFKSKKIITVSNFSKNRIVHYFGNKKDIMVTYNGITNSLVNYKNTEKKHFSFDFPYIVFVGNIKKHKGLGVLLEAFTNLKNKNFDPKLLIVGEMNNFKTNDLSLSEKFQNNKEIIFTGKITDNELFNIVQYANALIQPSTYEGFGIPPLEAIYLNTQPIISDIPVFKEIYANTPAVFFETDNIDDLERKILQFGSQKKTVLFDEDLIKLFNYKHVSKEILKFINF